MADIKIAIGMPCMTGSIRMQAVISIVKIISSLKYKRDFIFVNNTLIHVARRNIALQAQKLGSTHLLFLDSDMVVEGNVVDRLLAHDKDIIGVNAYQKALPRVTTVRKKLDDTHYMDADVPDTLFKCDALGTGCMLINMRVFDIIDKPWFFFDTQDEYPMGEDIWFCRQATRKGLEIWCDPTIPVKHVGEFEY